MVCVGPFTPKPPSNPDEARSIMDAHIAALRERSYESLRAIEGNVRRSYLGGFFKVMDGEGLELDEAVAPSGALYHLTTSVWTCDDGELSVEVELQEDAPPGGSLTEEFEVRPD
jgi:hypothetical protein